MPSLTLWEVSQAHAVFSAFPSQLAWGSNGPTMHSWAPTPTRRANYTVVGAGALHCQDPRSVRVHTARSSSPELALARLSRRPTANLASSGLRLRFCSFRDSRAWTWGSAPRMTSYLLTSGSADDQATFLHTYCHKIHQTRGRQDRSKVPGKLEGLPSHRGGWGGLTPKAQT